MSRLVVVLAFVGVVLGLGLDSVAGSAAGVGRRPAPGHATTCGALPQHRSAHALLSAFRVSRLHHDSVAGCTTHEVRQAYCRHHHCGAETYDAPGPLCLYRCGRYILRTLQVRGYEHDNGQRVAQLWLVISNGSRTIRQYEYLKIRSRHGTRLIVDVDNY